MIALMGGNEKFAAKLDENFSGGHYRHDNEPGHHYTYLYDYCGQPWKTQEQVRETMASQYHNGPDGLSGNDDCGQMSAWYIFSAMGFYPVTPGSPVYAIGSPLFQRATIMLTGPIQERSVYSHCAEPIGKEQIHSVGDPKRQTLKAPFIQHADIANGSTLSLCDGPADQIKENGANLGLRIDGRGIAQKARTGQVDAERCPRNGKSLI